MANPVNEKKENKIKNFFNRFVAKIDEKMQKQAKDSGCGCNRDNPKDKSCCS